MSTHPISSPAISRWRMCLWVIVAAVSTTLLIRHVNQPKPIRIHTDNSTITVRGSGDVTLVDEGGNLTAYDYDQ